ncbi:MAG TPA: GDP-mannose 4,6-dehydratase [Ramlibacter sp.]|nr:GDP-mannose 4,6-dehydratase [Ramlibacter sp.]
MRILLTGADGFTGREFIRTAAAAGHEIVELRSNLTHAPAVAREVSSLEFDSVVHLAAISFVGHSDDRAFYDVNLFGSLNLLEALKATRRPLRKVLVSSSANVYGNCEQAAPISEARMPAPVNHYAMSKLAMELMATARAADLPLVLTRPFNYTGPGQAPQFVIPKLVDHFRRRAPSVALGNLDVEREYNDVRFICEAYLRLLGAQAARGTYNVCTGVTHSFSAVIGMLAALTGHRIDVQIDPAFVRENEVRRLCGDPSRLQNAVGPLPLHRLEDTLSWMLSAPQ